MPMNYSDLVATKTTAGSIKQWLNHDGVPSTTILEEAEAWVYQRLRIRQMITSSAGTLTTSGWDTEEDCARGPNRSTNVS